MTPEWSLDELTDALRAEAAAFEMLTSASRSSVASTASMRGRSSGCGAQQVQMSRASGSSSAGNSRGGHSPRSDALAASTADGADAVGKKERKDGLPDFFTWGDWCAVEARSICTPGTGPQAAASNFLLALKAMAHMASVLGERADAAQTHGRAATHLSSRWTQREQHKVDCRDGR